MRRALIVGIDNYNQAPLSGCVNDANAMDTVLEAHGAGSPNFQIRLVTSPSEHLTRPKLRGAIEMLFATECDIALLYFSGHGFVRSGDGCIVTKDAEQHDEGILMTEILGIVNNSPVKNKIIILDCCYSGNMGTPNTADSSVAQLSEGLSVLTASRGSEVAVEQGGGGVFTDLVVAALRGGAADLRGHITPGSIMRTSTKPSVRGISGRSLRRTSHSSPHCARFNLKYRWKRYGNLSSTSQVRRTSTRSIRAMRTQKKDATQIT